MSPLELIAGRSLGLGIIVICPDIRWVKQIVTSWGGNFRCRRHHQSCGACGTVAVARLDRCQWHHQSCWTWSRKIWGAVWLRLWKLWMETPPTMVFLQHNGCSGSSLEELGLSFPMMQVLDWLSTVWWLMIPALRERWPWGKWQSCNGEDAVLCSFEESWDGQIPSCTALECLQCGRRGVLLLRAEGAHHPWAATREPPGLSIPQDDIIFFRRAFPTLNLHLPCLHRRGNSHGEPQKDSCTCCDL